MVIQFLLKITIVLAAALLIRAACYATSASFKHWVLSVCLFAVPVLTLWHCGGPKWQWVAPQWVSFSGIAARPVFQHDSSMADTAFPALLRIRPADQDNQTAGKSINADSSSIASKENHLADLMENRSGVQGMARRYDSKDRSSPLPKESGPFGISFAASPLSTQKAALSEEVLGTASMTRSRTTPSAGVTSWGLSSWWNQSSVFAAAGFPNGWVVSGLLWVWGAGAVVLLGRLGAGWLMGRRLLLASVAIENRHRNRLENLVPALKEGAVRILISGDREQMPMCIGLVGKTIVLPEGFQNWDSEQLQAVVSHELAHLTRDDAWVNLFAKIQTAFLWFHPLHHWFVRCLEFDCEVACDDWVIGQGISPARYAQALVDVSTQYSSDSLSWDAHSMTSRHTSLEYRINSVLNRENNRSPVGKVAQIGIACAGLLLISLVSAVFLVASPAIVIAGSSNTSEQRLGMPPVTSSSPSSIRGTEKDVFNTEVDKSSSTNSSVLSMVGLPLKSAAGPNASVGEVAFHPQLKAVNLGNWLMLEPWLLDLNNADFKDQQSILALLDLRFGEQKAEQLMDVYRSNWITLSDLQATKQLGFNAVRLPFDFGLVESRQQTMTLRQDAFEWIDHAVSICQQAGLMVILDLHGAPGGQSLDGPSGDAERNELWSNVDARRRTAWLWKQIAERYASSKTVVAYDVLNEPYGDFSQDLRETMLDLFEQIYQAIRSVDSETLIYAPATLDGFAFYGDPSKKGWDRVGFTHHAYPGLFDGRPAAVRSHEMFIKHWVEPVDRTVDRLGIPFLLGEYNVVFDDAGGAPLTAWYAREYARRGWSTAVWTLKRMLRNPQGGENSWALLTNDRPVEIDLRNDSYDDLNDAFESLGSLDWHTENKFLDAFSGRQQQWQWPKQPQWEAVEVGTDVSGWSILRGQNWVVSGAGRDIFGTSDRFHFQCQKVGGDFTASGRVLWIDETSPWAKSGWMIRQDDSIDAAHLSIHAIPDGKVLVAGRDAKGETSWQKTVSVGSLPVKLGMLRKGNNVVLSWTEASGEVGSWTHTPDFLTEAQTPLVGLAVCSLSPGIPTTCGWDQYVFRPTSAPLTPVDNLGDTYSTINFQGDTGGAQSEATTSGDSPTSSQTVDSGQLETVESWVEVAVANPSFETAGDSNDTAKNWNRWGQWINRETQWQPVKDGSAIIGYHHFRIVDATTSGVWQDVDVVAGKMLRFQVSANADLGNAAAAESVELRIEDVSGLDQPPKELAKKSFSVGQLATGSDWSTLEVVAKATSNKVRLVIVVVPSPDSQGDRDGSVKFDAVSLASQSGTEGAETFDRVTRKGISVLKNASFESLGDDGQMADWSQWGGGLNRQDQWKPVKTGAAILAYEHYRTSGNATSGIWQDVAVTPGAKLKFSVFANIDFGKGGTQHPGKVELKIESASDNQTMVTLAKKIIDAKDLSSGDAWSLLSIEGVALKDSARLLIIAHPSDQPGTRDGALKFDAARAEVIQ
jgi:beta-lactamase regulating signal transducer with metallopeptidase domain